MQVKLLCFGITKDIIGHFEYKIELTDNKTVGQLREKLIEQFPDFQKIKSLKFALDGEYVDDNATINPYSEIVLIPPVSGG